MPYYFYNVSFVCVCVSVYIFIVFARTLYMYVLYFWPWSPGPKCLREASPQVRRIVCMCFMYSRQFSRVIMELTCR